MIDVVLLIARVLFIALLFVFLFAIMKAGIGQVRGQREAGKAWTIAVERGPKELRGVRIRVNGPVVVGRDPSCDIVIGANYVSARQAKFSLLGRDLFVEDLGSTNGTKVNDETIRSTTALSSGDVVGVGGVTLRVRFD